MKTSMLAPIWYCSPVSVNDGGAIENGYTNLRETSANIQTDRSELDVQSFGEYVNEITKFRFKNLPDIKKGDAIYLRRPSSIGTFEKDGVEYNDYGRGDFRVEQVLPSFVGIKRFKNPTTIIARAETK